MSEELAIQLHRLYRDYYARRLHFDDYRHRRAILLDSLLDAHGAATDDVDELTQPRGQEVAAEEAGPVSPEPPSGVAAGRGFEFRWYYVLGACVIVVVAVVGLVIGQLDGPGEELSQPFADEPGATMPAPGVGLGAVEEQRTDDVVQPPAVGQRLVEEFVARDDWRPLSVVEFQDSWKRLPEADRIVAKGMAWFEPMTQSLAYQIEEILDFSENPEDDEQLEHLYELALHLGLVELVPPGWMPDPDSINRGASELAVSTTQTDAVAADTPAEETRQLAEEPVEQPQDVSDVAEEVTSDEEAAVAQTAAAQAGNDRACSEEQLRTRRRNCIDVLADGSNGPPMRVLPAGEFVMGSEDADSGTRQVVMARPFAMSLFEIRFADFGRYCTATGARCPDNPWGGDDMPVVNVSLEEANAYAAWLSAETGVPYRLPTEEEWEYAARAGTGTEYPHGDDLLPAQARYSSITTYESPLPASDRTTQRNEFGLWHVVGNVREWVAGSSSIVRGGSYASDADELRSWAREELPSAAGDNQTGIRLLREL